MNGPVVTGTETASVRDAARVMKEKEIGSLVIVRNGKPVGIVTRTDIIDRAASKNLKPSRVTCGRIMSKPLQTVDVTADLSEAARKMMDLHIKRLGVVRDRSLVGIVTVSDIASVAPEIISLLYEKARITTGESVRGLSNFDGFCDTCGRWSIYLKEIDGSFLCEECKSDGGRGEEE